MRNSTISHNKTYFQESVGPDSIPGYGRVKELAAYLVSHRNDIYLTNAQVTHLIQLWNDLHDYDKAPTVFLERFSREARGRYKAKKHRMWFQELKVLNGNILLLCGVSSGHCYSIFSHTRRVNPLFQPM